MKNFLLVCLMGLGMLLPSTTITAKESAKKRIVNVGIEGYVLLSSSQTEDGPITLVEVKKLPDGKLMSTQSGDGSYSAQTDISWLPAGAYVVKVVTTNTSYTKQFRKQ